MKTEKKLIKEMVDDGIRCLKIEDKDGVEVEAVYLNDDYTSFIKVSKFRSKYADNLMIKSYIAEFINLLVR